MEWRVWIAWWVIFYIRYSRLAYIFKKHGEKIDNLSLQIYINKTQNRITFKIKAGYHPEILMPGWWYGLEERKVG